VIPPTKNAAFVWRMEEVLDLYAKSLTMLCDPLRPVICFDERPCQLIGDVRDPLPMKPGYIERLDSEYERGGCLLGLDELRALERLARSGGYRAPQKARVRLNDAAPGRRDLPTSREDAGGVGQPLHPHAQAASFYESFPPKQAHRLARRIEFCYTPVHGSWLNMVEVESR
jgi:hypothetical protein